MKVMKKSGFKLKQKFVDIFFEKANQSAQLTLIVSRRESMQTIESIKSSNLTHSQENIAKTYA